MEVYLIRFSEHLATNCSISLEEFCFEMQKRFGLPDFKFDSENETEWGSVQFLGIEYNVSRPFEKRTLQEWDETVPAGCNFGISLTVSKKCPPEQDINWSKIEFVPHIGQNIADLFGQTVYHHRTWLKIGNNLSQNRLFTPKLNLT